MSEKKLLWTDQRSGFLESLQYLEGRMLGHIKSLRTPWPKFNDATVDGIEWNSLTVVAGRPGSGKTLLKDQIIRESFILNPGEDFRILEFQFEMLQRVSAIREYSSLLGKSYKYLCSAEGATKLKPEELNKCYEYAKTRVKYPIDIVEKPRTVNEIRETIVQYMEHHRHTNENRRYRNTVVTLDHSMLVKLDKNEKNKLEMIYNLGEVLTDLKRNYPIAFIVLSQLNRNVDTPERNEDGKIGNHILESDIFGGDALLQHADTLVGLNRPGKQKIRFYGPERYIIENDKVLVMHYLKCRNGSTRMSFFKSEFESMRISEMMTPGTQTRSHK